MPYGFYQLVRFVAFIGFAILAYQGKKEGDISAEVIVYIALALLFQPFLKVSLGRELWNVVDAIVGLGLIISLFMSKSSKQMTS